MNYCRPTLEICHCTSEARLRCCEISLAELVIELSGTESEIIHEALPEDDPRRRCPEIRR
ncbi:MAG: hypothetical protein ACJ73W_08295 [Rubrobacteraceae bacterium]